MVERISGEGVQTDGRDGETDKPRLLAQGLGAPGKVKRKVTSL